jgi:outer membrane protein OmpA-like peptidoglycan-associated protein/tetratricopeptide (TPR) repeat protein
LTEIKPLEAAVLHKCNFNHSGHRINQKKMRRNRGCFLKSFLIALLFLAFSGNSIFSQGTDDCPDYKGKKADKVYDNALKAFLQRDYSEAIRSLNQVIEIEPDYVDAYFVLGLIYIEDSRMNLKTARKHFNRVIELCPGYDVYAYYHLARIAYGAGEYKDAHRYVTRFLEDVDLIRSDEDYEEAVQLLEYSAFFNELMGNPVPFNPKPVQGISTPLDEYLPIISPDNEMALFTRKIKIPPRRDDLTPQVRYRERFMYSRRNGPTFEEGGLMPLPFNQHDNEGGATLTIDNKTLYYTLCKHLEDRTYYNCDICYSEFRSGSWTEIQSISDKVNQPDSWESQPTITSDGQTLYFVSDRDGGYGGYDIYKTQKDESGNWGHPVNMGPKINTSGNEKSPFIHTDSQTLYFSSDGHMGLGGYDIFFTKHSEDGSWTDPENIGYPINSPEDDVGFFVSTDGHYGYFASNKFEGIGGWDLYYFDLYEEARPEKVLFVKGKIEEVDDSGLKETRVELKNTETKEVTSIPVDTITGEYVAAVLFREDHILTVKRKGYVQESNYISQIDPRYSSPAKLTVSLKPVEIGESYRLNDIYFDFNSFELGRESKIVIEEFADFLFDNPSMKVSIEGHTDNIGNEGFNLILSEKRAKSVYDHLISQGISTGQIDYRGFGQSKPIASNATDEGRALNRRTEFVIIEK